MASQTTFRPFVAAGEERRELSVRALLLGAVFGVIFGAVTVYVGLRAGLTVAASIPISVLSISILRVFGRASILENNIVQTTGNAGQSIASGVIFTLPALIFLGFDLEASRIFALALFGGWLGVLFMIPLRRQLIVDEHATLVYPEGTACADVLQAGERGGSFASRVFLGLGLGGLYTLFQNDNLLGLFPPTPNYQPNFDPNGQQILKGAAIRADVTPEYLGVGYIIGIRVASIMLAGGVFSWLVLMPAIVFFGKHLSGPLYPGTVPINEMSPSLLWKTYVRPMGAGAVAASGLITLLRTAPTIVSALKAGVATIGKGKAVAAQPSRTDHDMPMSVVLGGSLLLIVLMFAFLQFKPVPRSAGKLAGEYCGEFADRGVWIFVCDGVGKDRRDRWVECQPGKRYDDRDVDGDGGDLPGEGVDSSGVWGAGDYDWRRGLRGGLECRRYESGSEDRLSDWGDAVEAAAGCDGGRDRERVCDWAGVERDEPGI